MSVSPSELALWRATLALPQIRWAPLAPLLELLSDNSQVAELGSFAGESSCQFLACPKVAHLHCVDFWEGGYDDADLASGCDMKVARAAFDVRMSAFDSKRYSVLKARTDYAAGLTKPESLDLVYIDADHRYESVKVDIKAWRSKVKPGGLLAGHDYSVEAHWGVERAVNELLGSPLVFPDSSWVVRI